MSNTSQIRVGVTAGLFGALATAAAFVLTDKKLRSKMLRVMYDYMEEGSEKLNDIQDKLVDTVSDKKEKVTKKATKVVDEVQKL